MPALAGRLQSHGAVTPQTLLLAPAMVVSAPTRAVAPRLGWRGIASDPFSLVVGCRMRRGQLRCSWWWRLLGWGTSVPG
jgi:hypothetical protein